MLTQCIGHVLLTPRGENHSKCLSPCVNMKNNKNIKKQLDSFGKHDEKGNQEEVM